MTLKEFRRSVYQGLLAPAYVRDKQRAESVHSNRSSAVSSPGPAFIKRHKPTVPKEIRLESSRHQSERSTSRRCCNCSTKISPVRTVWQCNTCKVPLCLRKGKTPRINTAAKKTSSKRVKITISRQPSEKSNVLIRKKTESDKHQQNVKEILLCSNATPIRRRVAVGYVCCFCTDSYPNPADLKDHTIKAHDDNTKSSYLKGSPMLNFIVKLDITDLKCKICDNNIKGIEDLIQHLQIEHNKRLHNDIKSHLIPFRFGNNLLRCVYCTKECNNFKIMLEHMNVHYNNYVCDVCGAGFVNKRILMTHAYRHKTGVFKCDYCAKVFDTRIKMKEHERAVHICLNKRSKCGYCGEKFTDYAKKNDHETKVHGAKLIILKCQACDKSFDNQRALTVHTKSYHLLERYNKKTV